MVASTLPRRAAGKALPRRARRQARGKPVTFRTSISAATRCCPISRGAHRGREPGARLAGDPPDAGPAGPAAHAAARLLKASGGRELKLMLPMVTELGEIAQAREIIDREVRHLSRFAHGLPTSLKLGAMLEVPSLLVPARRTDEGGRFRLGRLQRSVPVRHGGRPRQHAWPTASTRCRRRSCGCCADRRCRRPQQHAGDAVRRTGRQADSAMALIGLGFRSISMSPASIGPVKAMLTELPLDELRRSSTTI
jgi:phosphotransferase system enzyme I (PtsP)